MKTAPLNKKTTQTGPGAAGAAVVVVVLKHTRLLTILLIFFFSLYALTITLLTDLFRTCLIFAVYLLHFSLSSSSSSTTLTSSFILF